MKVLKGLSLIACAAISSNALANDLVCPTSVKIGHPLVVTSATIHNSDCSNPITLQHSIATLIGNSNGALALQGPFVGNITGNVPPATCAMNYSDGLHTLNNIKVVNSVPAGMAGTLAIVSIGYLDAQNNLQLIGKCHITVTK